MCLWSRSQILVRKCKKDSAGTKFACANVYNIIYVEITFVWILICWICRAPFYIMHISLSLISPSIHFFTLWFEVFEMVVSGTLALQLLLCQCEQLSCHFYNGLVPLLSWLHSSLILIVIRNSIDQSAPGHEWKNPKKNHCQSKKLQYCYLTHYNKHNATIHLMSRLSQLLHDVDLL